MHRLTFTARSLDWQIHRFVIHVVLIAGVLLLVAVVPVTSAGLPRLPAPFVEGTSDVYVVLAWNDLGMHCYNRDFQYLAVLPPFNTLYAQVVRQGDPPLLVTEGISVTYAFADNTYSVNKSNFWQYDQALFGVDLTPNTGLAGKGMAGTMDLRGDHFVAEGIPLTEYRDSDYEANPANPAAYPYQLATVSVWEASTGNKLAETMTVAPVSTEMNCNDCHHDGGVEDIATGSVEKNILTLHDEEHMAEYPVGHTGSLVTRAPILCAECHASNALNAPGVTEIPSLSRAMHEKHGEDEVGLLEGIAGCYQCHPGPQTQCLRDTMAQQGGLICQDCHGTLAQVAANPTPWLNEPRCDSANCHGTDYEQNQPLYRLSQGHSDLFCSGCHDSPHAIAPSREGNDAIKFIALQNSNGPLATCTVCHSTAPAEAGPHGLRSSIAGTIYLPYVGK